MYVVYAVERSYLDPNMVVRIFGDHSGQAHKYEENAEIAMRELQGNPEFNHMDFQVVPVNVCPAR